MLFNKFQYKQSEIDKRGYSQSCIASDENGKQFWVKWAHGLKIEESEYRTFLVINWHLPISPCNLKITQDKVLTKALSKSANLSMF